MTKMKRRIISGSTGLAMLFLLIWAFLPSPVVVDTGRVERGAMQVTVDEEGKTRVRDRYVIAAPVTGHLSRIGLQEGDAVDAGAVVAHLRPSPLGARELAEARARVDAAEARFREAEARVAQAQVACDEAATNHQRVEQVAAVGGVSEEAREQAENAAAIAERMLDAAKFNAQAAASELEATRAALLALHAQRDGNRAVMDIAAPAQGRVLRVFEKSGRVVPAGTPLLEIGDPGALEIVIDVLSGDAVNIRPGAPVIVEDWGGVASLWAEVRMVEPSAFTKVSALGVEEQRVNVIADLPEPPASLGDGFRVEARIVVWESDDALHVPTSALFRNDEGWSVFAVENETARRHDIKIGHRNAVRAEVLEGLEAGMQVILHPTNQIEDGVWVTPRR